MFHKLLKAGALACVLLLLLTGCASRKELKTLGIVNSTLYDLKDDGSIALSAEVLKPSSGGAKGQGGQDSPTVIISAQGKTIPESIRNASDTFDRQLYAPHNKVRFFSEKMVKNGILPAMDYLLRSHEIRQTAYMFVVKGDNPQQIYSAALGIENNVGDFIDGMSTTETKSTSASDFVDVITFMKAYYLDGREPVLGVVEMVPNNDSGEKSAGEADKSAGGGDKSSGGGESDKKKNKLKCQGLAAFKGDKLVGYLNGDETRCYNLLDNGKGKFNISISYKNHLAVLEKIHSKSKASVELTDGHVNIKVSVNLSFILNQLDAAVPVTPDTVEEMEKIINQRLADEIAAVIKKVQQEFKGDIFGFGEQMHEQNPDVWANVRDNWNDAYFSPATVSVEVTSALNRVGVIEDAFAYESE